MDPKLKFEYEQTMETWRMLADIRFKLLGLVPAISGIALALLLDNLFATESSPGAILIVALIGFFVTVGITFYDQRNSQLSNSAFHHARELERRMELPLNGHLHARPGRNLHTFGIKIWHDRGLALIYGSVLAGWIFIVVFAGLLLFNVTTGLGFIISFAVFVLATVLLIQELHRLDDAANHNPYKDIVEKAAEDE